MGALKPILEMLPVTEREQLMQFFRKQQKTEALHKELIRQLNESMALNKVVLNAAGEGIIAVDENHMIIDLNPALAKMFGYTERELKGQNLDVLLPEEALEKHDLKMCEFKQRSQSLLSGNAGGKRTYGVHKTKGPFRISVAISHGLKNGEKIYAGIIRDLTHQDRLERENAKQARKLANRAKELEGLYNVSKLLEEDNVPAIIKKLISDIVPKSTKYPEKAVTIIELDGHTYRSSDQLPVVSLTSQLHNGSLTFGFTEDLAYGTSRHQRLLDTFTAELDQIILHKKSVLRELQVERKTATNELSSGVAHNVNNGLQIIQGYAQVALGLADSPEIKEPLQKISDKTRELGATVRGILQATDFPPDKIDFEIVDLNELLDDYLASAENPLKSEALRQGTTVTINRQAGADAFVYGSRDEITLITQTLIKNSIDSFLEDGSIDIRTSRKGEYVYLQVRDSGRGMAEDAQRKIFDPHFTTKGSGPRKGLSLSTAQRIAREHGGEIRLLQSRVGQGTTMALRLPYAQHQERKQVRECEERASLRILWAEDDIIIQETIKAMTETFDDQVDFAQNGKIAMEMLRQKAYDVLITDVGMPVMGGWELLKRITGRYDNMIRVIASGYVINTNDLSSSGASHLLNKPLEKDELIGVLEHIKTRPSLAHQNGLGHSTHGRRSNGNGELKAPIIHSAADTPRFYN